MPSDALALAPVILAVVLVVSAVGKLRSPSASAEAFRDLRVPAPLSGRLVVEALPWGELLLAVALLLVGGQVGVVAAVAALLLFTAYLVLVVRAVGFDEDVDCACFGEFAPGRITRRTVVRNAWLVLLAVLAVIVAAQGSSVAARVADERLPWWWLVAAVAAAVTTVLVVGGRAAAPETRQDPTAYAEDEGDYVRYRTPALPVTLGDGSTTNLRALSSARAQLLLYVSDTCGSCEAIIAAAPVWSEELTALDVRLVLRNDPDQTQLTSAAEPQTVHDRDGLLVDSFGVHATPSALLLGADGLLAGGPVVGVDHVKDFVSDIRAELGLPV
ncbi:MauE/DoxX family redox-associated membrane protein [Terracoccus sp. 273MFTsu3.1]|uniref:MauE/DoxX family redox-associated membrane protein n=1 Tax=Terracoccus sp. 273MFTsu3.1 TaxID=1172188 RepID=UPI000376F16F|nr:MauE/DoxX family redox-associated membrane protein [Terracoccus sp. 273MFTsu3.1]